MVDLRFCPSERHGVTQVVLRADDIAKMVEQIVALRARGAGVICVAVDGRSGAGKSTLAKQLARAIPATLLDGDSFFAGGVAVRSDSPEERARDCIDWRRQRVVLEALRAGHPASYAGFDWEAFDGRLERELTVVELASSRIVIVEGVYSARPELADLLDLRLLLRVPDDVRMARLLGREQSFTAWERQWHEAEEWYFGNAAPPAGFDIIVEG
jgi:uridine kinase